MSARLTIIHDDGLGMNWPGEHPMDGRRHRLTMTLCAAAGIADAPGVRVVPAPGPLGDEELALTFAPAFIAAIRRYDASPVLAAAPEAAQWGIDGDNGAYAGMHADAARLAAASARAARLVAGGETRHAFVPATGTHHGMANRAGGFGLYNDTAAAITAARRAGAERVAYIDLDVHHGNGTQWIFYEDPMVLTVSVHESGRHLFPGSGFVQETGGPGAEGSSVNLPLAPFAGDDDHRRAVEEIVVPAVRSFGPDLIVAQCGVDHHHADPLSHLVTTLDWYPRLWAILRELAEDAAGGRLVALGGGGYEPCSAPPRAWGLLAAELAGVAAPEELPDAFRSQSLELGCPEPPVRWRHDPPPEVEPGRREAAAAETERVIAEARATLGRFLAL